MEDTITQAPTSEVILLRENANEINRITSEALRRCDALNKLSRQGMAIELLNDLRTARAIDVFIHAKVKAGNQTYRDLLAAGIKVDVTIPAELDSLKIDLMLWAATGSTQFLSHADRGEWVVDDDQLQEYFIANKLREYLPEEHRDEYQYLLSVCEYLKAKQAPNNQFVGRENSFWSQRIEPVAMSEFKPRPSYFLPER